MFGVSMVAGLGAGAVAGAAYVGVPRALRHVQTRRLRDVCAEHRLLVLSYDDGPSTTCTPKVLELLAAHDAAATFFLVGAHAERHPELAEKLQAAGHELGCHTYGHRNALKTSPWAGVADILQGYRALSRWIPGDATFRPPYGKMSLATLATTRRRGAPLGWWTVVSGDTHQPLDADCGHVVDAVQQAGGGVVLMHDHHPKPERIDYVCELTRRLLDLARRENMRVCRLKDVHAIAMAGGNSTARSGDQIQTANPGT